MFWDWLWGIVTARRPRARPSVEVPNMTPEEHDGAAMPQGSPLCGVGQVAGTIPPASLPRSARASAVFACPEGPPPRRMRLADSRQNGLEPVWNGQRYVRVAGSARYASPRPAVGCAADFPAGGARLAWRGCRPRSHRVRRSAGTAYHNPAQPTAVPRGKPRQSLCWPELPNCYPFRNAWLQ